MTYTFIARACSDLPVAVCCRVMKVSTSGFYANLGPWVVACGCRRAGGDRCRVAAQGCWCTDPDRTLQVLLAHPGGPLWARRDLGAWSIPKGEHSDEEDALAAARREFVEIDRAEWFTVAEARRRILDAQVEFLDHLVEELRSADDHATADAPPSGLH